jgi:hypothetical protein
MLAATLDVDESLDRLLNLVVPLMADWCTVHLLDPDGPRAAGRRPAPRRGQVALLRRIEELQPPASPTARAPSKVLSGGAPCSCARSTSRLCWRASTTRSWPRSTARSACARRWCVPLRARRQVLGALSLFTDGSGRSYDDDDLVTAADLARRAGPDRRQRRLYQREHEVAEQLQRSLLPQLPTVAGLDRWARYLPGSTAAQVGGDWYDLFRLPDGPLGIAIGDVMGHDMAAAPPWASCARCCRATPGRAATRRRPRPPRPARAGPRHGQLATCAYGRLDLPTGTGPGGCASRTPATCRRRCARRTARAADRHGGVAAGRRRPRHRARRGGGGRRARLGPRALHRRASSSTAAAPRRRACRRWPTRSRPRPTRRRGDRASTCSPSWPTGDLDDDVALLVVRVLA